MKASLKRNLQTGAIGGAIGGMIGGFGMLGLRAMLVGRQPLYDKAQIYYLVQGVVCLCVFVIFWIYRKKQSEE